jgi:hypothetical protein
MTCKRIFFLISFLVKEVPVSCKLLLLLKTLQHKREGNWMLRRHREIIEAEFYFSKLCRTVQKVWNNKKERKERQLTVCLV